jgi:hypothetical protein
LGLEHGKHSKIMKTFGIDEKPLQDVFEDIIGKAIITLNSLIKEFL